MLGFPAEFYYEMEGTEKLLQQPHLYRSASMRLGPCEPPNPNVANRKQNCHQLADLLEELSALD